MSRRNTYATPAKNTNSGDGNQSPFTPHQQRQLFCPPAPKKKQIHTQYEETSPKQEPTSCRKQRKHYDDDFPPPSAGLGISF